MNSLILKIEDIAIFVVKFKTFHISFEQTNACMCVCVFRASRSRWMGQTAECSPVNTPTTWRAPDKSPSHRPTCRISGEEWFTRLSARSWCPEWIWRGKQESSTGGDQSLKRHTTRMDRSLASIDKKRPRFRNDANQRPVSYRMF